MQVITDKKLYRSIWDKIYQEYFFSTQNEKWLCPDTTYDVYHGIVKKCAVRKHPKSKIGMCQAT